MATGPNVEQERFWNETAGPTWVRLNDLVDPMIAPLGRLAMERAALAPGERVVDVGCGCGKTWLELARRVAPGRTLTRGDVSAPNHAVARERATGRDGVRFERADAQTHAFAPSSFDVLYSRFGVMFFVDPTAAFANLRTALRPGGRAAFVCWQAVPSNPWMYVPVGAAAQVIPLPPPPAPDAPGPFSFGDPERVRGILSGAGFVDVDVAPYEGTLTLPGGGDVDATVEFLLQMGPAASRCAKPRIRRPPAGRGGGARGAAPTSRPRGRAWAAGAGSCRRGARERGRRSNCGPRAVRSPADVFATSREPAGRHRGVACGRDIRRRTAGYPSGV
jgi:SAM-dependent methyltransferase